MSRIHNLCLQLPKLECLFPSPQLPPCTTFTLFPYLPLELRNKVWELAACVSQDIILTREKNRPRSYHPPAIMHTSREARQEGSRYYTQCRDVAHIYTPPILNPYRDYTRTPKNILWINFAVDRFVFTSFVPLQPWTLQRIFFNFDDQLLEQIQHFVIPSNLISNSELQGTFSQQFNYLLKMKSQTSTPFDISVTISVTTKLYYGTPEPTDWTGMSRELGKVLDIRNAVADFEKNGKKLPIAW